MFCDFSYCRKRVVKYSVWPLSAARVYYCDCFLLPACAPRLLLLRLFTSFQVFSRLFTSFHAPSRAGYYATRPLLKNIARLLDQARRTASHLSFLLRLPALRKPRTPGTASSVASSEASSAASSASSTRHATAECVQNEGFDDVSRNIQGGARGQEAFHHLVEEAVLTATAHRRWAKRALHHP